MTDIARNDVTLARPQGRPRSVRSRQRLIEGYHAATVAGAGADSFWAALATLDLAALRHARGRDAEARDLLRRHLPQVRDTVLPTHPDRAAAEALARRLGGIEDVAAAAR